ncbi:MAG: hypothetical protein O9336_18675 [Microcystis sp. LE19-98.1E]|nr:hypothetical protein [Microcystis sp. LE19-98.1E]
MERIAQLEARKKALQARLTKQERAVDTRRKVLLGALVLQRLETGHDPEFTRRLSDWLKRELPGFLIRENDRALFPEFIDQKPGSAGNVTGAVSGGGARNMFSDDTGSAEFEPTLPPAHLTNAGDLR